MHHNPPADSEHAQAVLFMTSRLAEMDCTIISSNTDEAADPQIFAQNEEMDFVFYFIRANPKSEPDNTTINRWMELANHHQVEPYYIPVTTTDNKFDIIPVKSLKQQS